LMEKAITLRGGQLYAEKVSEQYPRYTMDFFQLLTATS
jgi:hypothetical protein